MEGNEKPELPTPADLPVQLGNVDQATASTPSVPDLGLTALQRAGFNLTRSVMLGGFLVLLSFVLGYFVCYPDIEDVSCSSERQRVVKKLLEDETTPNHHETLKLLSEAQTKDQQALLELRKDFFASWLELFKTVVLITIVPILTSLLGYTFGNQSVK